GGERHDDSQGPDPAKDSGPISSSPARPALPSKPNAPRVKEPLQDRRRTGPQRLRAETAVRTKKGTYHDEAHPAGRNRPGPARGLGGGAAPAGQRRRQGPAGPVEAGRLRHRGGLPDGGPGP